MLPESIKKMKCSNCFACLRNKLAGHIELGLRTTTFVLCKILLSNGGTEGKNGHIQRRSSAGVANYL